MDVVLKQVISGTRLAAAGVTGCCQLLEEGNTIPFIARYRKEQTGGLDEEQIRAVRDALAAVQALIARRKTVLAAIEKQGKLTPELRAAIENCWDKQELEDLYLPYRQKRKTRAETARKRGLEPLAMMILGKRPAPSRDRMEVARAFVDSELGVANPAEALEGARDIVAEVLATHPPARAAVRELGTKRGRIKSTRKRGAGDEAEAFRDYLDRSEPVASVPPHRLLAMFRGETQGALSVKVEVHERRGTELVETLHPSVPQMFRGDFTGASRDGWQRLLWPAVEREILGALKERADRASVKTFEQNLRTLLMAPPVRGKRVLALDPGFAHGCKTAVVDGTGEVLGTATVYPHPPRQQTDRARETLLGLAKRHRVDVIAVGDGTAHRESMAFLERTRWPHPVEVEAVREAGASVYSASPVARDELPDMDVSLRGAVSIGRRFQDPLAELVKIDPKALGVGQYQHDVDQTLLARGLDAVVEECVNRVGVELNTASPALLARVAGIGPTSAGAIVEHRSRIGAFRKRSDLLKVSGIGKTRFTQCAGFLRVPDGTEPLDRTGVHPENYSAVKVAARRLGTTVKSLLGDDEAVVRLRTEVSAADLGIGAQSWADILDELQKPARDPRGERVAFSFSEEVDSIDDLSEGMILPGRVNSVTDFGAFVDIGVHRDGLVHISQMADRRVSTPFDICKPGMTVRVKVTEVDRKRNRIGLTMKPSELGDPGSRQRRE